MRILSGHWKLSVTPPESRVSVPRGSTVLNEAECDVKNDANGGSFCHSSS